MTSHVSWVPRSSEVSPCCCCTDAAVINAVFAMVVTNCPACVEDPSNPGIFVSMLNNGLTGSFALNLSTGFWFFIDPTGGSYNSYTDAGCSVFDSSSAGALVVTAICGATGYGVSATVSTGFDSITVFLANNMRLGVAAANELPCGGTVTLSI